MEKRSEWKRPPLLLGASPPSTDKPEPCTHYYCIVRGIYRRWQGGGEKEGEASRLLSLPFLSQRMVGGGRREEGGGVDVFVWLGRALLLLPPSGRPPLDLRPSTRLILFSLAKRETASPPPPQFFFFFLSLPTPPPSSAIGTERERERSKKQRKARRKRKGLSCKLFERISSPFQQKEEKKYI